jgi:uncharacterized membrane protein
MDPFTQLCLASAAFLATHFASSTPLRPALAGAIGEKGYLGLYTLVSFATLGWMIWAYGQAPSEAAWPGLRMLPALLMPFSFVLIACGLLTRNPTAVGAAKFLKAPEAARGILRVTRHPVMWGFILWSGAHLLARGDLKGLVFFGSFLVLASLGALLIDARKARNHGEDWRRFAAVTSYFPFAAILQGRNRFDAKEIGLRNPAIGLALYAAAFWLHPMAFGARPY